MLFQIPLSVIPYSSDFSGIGKKISRFFIKCGNEEKSLPNGNAEYFLSQLFFERLFHHAFSRDNKIGQKVLSPTIFTYFQVWLYDLNQLKYVSMLICYLDSQQEHDLVRKGDSCFGYFWNIEGFRMFAE